MYKKLVFALAVLSVVAVAPLLSACQTTAGAGKDILQPARPSQIPPKKHAP